MEFKTLLEVGLIGMMGIHMKENYSFLLIMALDRLHIQMAITIKDSGMKVKFKVMGPINSVMDLIIKDNFLIINLKVLDNITTKMTI
jgi:hypothetical protein